MFRFGDLNKNKFCRSIQNKTKSEKTKLKFYKDVLFLYGYATNPTISCVDLFFIAVALHLSDQTTKVSEAFMRLYTLPEFVRK